MFESAFELREHLRKEHNRVVKKGIGIQFYIDRTKYLMVKTSQNEYNSILKTYIDEWLQELEEWTKKR